MGRAPCCDKANVKRGPWSPEEDATLKTYVEAHGTGGNWIALPRKAGLRRCGKSCRLRWLNYLRPDIKHGGFTEEEDNVICTLYGQMGSRWSTIASQLPGRTDNDVKNYWNTKLKKKLMAGKVNLKTMTNSGSLPSTPLRTRIVQTQTQNSDFPASQNQNSSLSTLPILTNANSGFNINAQTMSLDPTQLYSPGFMESSGNSHMMSSSQEGPSISGSSVIAMDNKCISLLDYAGDEATKVLMDFGFESPCDLVNGLYSPEKAGEFAPSYYPELVDFSYADMKLQGLNQNVT